MMNIRAWASFWTLGLIWGSSFMFIRIGVTGGLRPIEVVFIRTFIAAVGLNAVIFLRRVPFPTDWPTLRSLAIIGIGNVVMPYLLISWGEQTVPSSIAAVLQSAAALFTLVIAHFAFADERMTLQKVVGLMLGFSGVIVLFSRDLSAENPFEAGIAGQVAIVTASMFYATFIVYSRKVLKGDVPPVVVSGVTMLTAAAVTAPFALLADGGFTPLHTTVSSDTLAAVGMLGLLNTFIAYLFFYFIVRELGAARASMVTYIVPPVGVVLGAVFLGEQVGIALLLGAGLIFAGIGIVNLRRFGGLRRRVKSETLA